MGQDEFDWCTWASVQNSQRLFEFFMSAHSHDFMVHMSNCERCFLLYEKAFKQIIEPIMERNPSLKDVYTEASKTKVTAEGLMLWLNLGPFDHEFFTPPSIAEVNRTLARLGLEPLSEEVYQNIIPEMEKLFVDRKQERSRIRTRLEDVPLCEHRPESDKRYCTECGSLNPRYAFDQRVCDPSEHSTEHDKFWTFSLHYNYCPRCGIRFGQ